MSTRTSFQLHADGCRVAEVHVRPSGRGSSPTALSASKGAALSLSKADVRVSAFVPNVPGADGPELAGVLARLRQDRTLASEACATIWGLRSSYQFLRLPLAKDSDLRALATPVGPVTSTECHNGDLAPTRVELFYANGGAEASLGDVTAPFSFSSVPMGVHAVRVVKTSNPGARSIVAQDTIVVRPSSVHSPSSGSNHQPPTTDHQPNCASSSQRT